ncbi:NADP-dependent oxidoreductase [Actinacidiphila bryophytorum]|uniref:NADP-dependent oxidoreductase n=1 Tax=Actinacidiphila bryophytorum TaxID=1436133 RepID=UPI002176D852|nr:NADP-dependent oxidoreductase [Actinacidiphila bryophytorum]UWE07555.1 NADP-dependent oxidoreductase [Actinacidiphila bryophytorum]
MARTMRALVAADYGPPETYVVTEVPVPRPGPGQLQVKVAAAALNAADIVLPGGDYRAMVEVDFPHVPGNDFAGTVTEVGPDVSGYAPGDEVFGFALPRVLRPMAGAVRPSLGTGSLAEYVVVEADTPFVAHRPPALPVDQAAALPIVGTTARALIAAGAFRADETVLVVGATGGVGTTVLPLLAAAGTRVIATATASDATLVRQLGASEVIDYRTQDVPAQTLRQHPAGIDAVLNLYLPGTQLPALAPTLRPGGRLLTITPPPPTPETLGRPDVTATLVLDMEAHYGGMPEVAADASAGPLKATITRRYALTDAAQACVAFTREHTTGKILVTMHS